MGWEQLAALIIQVGLPLALRIYDNVMKKGAVTPQEIEELKKLSQATSQTQMRDAIARAGLNPEDPKAKELMAMIGG